MVKSRAALFLTLLVLAVAAASGARAQKPDYVSEEEEDRIRDAQEPSERIEVYLTIAQSRLDRIEQFRSQPMDPAYDNGAYIDRLLDEYISLTDDLKNWVQDRYDRREDMRKGLRKVLEMGPKQLHDLQHIQDSPDADAADYAKSLRDAKDDISDAMDGATKALGDQVKMLGELKSPQEQAKAEKDRSKEEKKKNKEEEKLRKKERKENPPADKDD